MCISFNINDDSISRSRVGQNSKSKILLSVQSKFSVESCLAPQVAQLPVAACSQGNLFSIIFIFICFSLDFAPGNFGAVEIMQTMDQLTDEKSKSAHGLVNVMETIVLEMKPNEKYELKRPINIFDKLSLIDCFVLEYLIVCDEL